AAGISLKQVDAIGARVSWLSGAGIAGGASVDVLLNLSAGQFSLYGSPAGGAMLGASDSVVAGYQLLRNLKSNDEFRGGFGAVGLSGGGGLAGNVEFFSSAPMTNRFNPTDKAHGVYLGLGLGGGLSGYGDIS